MSEQKQILILEDLGVSKSLVAKLALSMDNVILTPHIAYKTEEALGRRARTTFENIRAFFGGRDTNRVA